MTTADQNWNEPTKEQIDAWKKEYNIDVIHKLNAMDTRDRKIKSAYMRPPTMADFIRAAQSNKDKVGTYNQSLYENCVLAAHPDIQKYQPLYQGMVFNVDKIVSAAEVEVEKL